MKRLGLPLLFALLITLALGIAYGIGANKTILKIATIAPSGNMVTDGLQKVSVLVAQRSAGRLQLKVYPGGVMGNDAVVIRKMRTNQLQGATFTAGGISMEYRDYQIMSLPMLFRSYAEVDAVKPKIEPIITAGLQKNGYVSMGIMEVGFVYMMSNKPLRGIPDIRGQKIWIPEGDPVGRTVFETAGVPPIPLPLTDVLTGLQTGLIDTICGSPVAAVALQWYTKIKYITETPLVYAYATIAFSKSAWDKLEPNDREILRQEVKDLITRSNAQVRRENQAAMETLRKQGIQFVQVTPQNLPGMQKVADDSITKLLAQGHFDANLVAQIRAIVKSIRSGQ